MKQPTRRRFLKRSCKAAFAAGAALAASPLAFPGAPGSGERVRVAVIGIRGRGRNHASGFAAIAGAEVAAVCDVDSRLLPEVQAETAAAQKKKPDAVQDFRRLLDDKSIHAISIATPDHWHALATILGCVAGKDVYVEKPCSHNIREGRAMVDAARKLGRVVQHGTQSRSGETFLSAREFLRKGELGRILVAKVINSQLRDDIGRKSEEPVPPGVDYDLWLGPAPKRPFHPNRFHYNWHWHWDYGTGDLGNDSVHPIDYARWMLGVEDPIAVSASGTKLHFRDDQETPDTQHITWEFEGCHLVSELKIWCPYREHGMENGAVFYGENGYMTLSPQGWQVIWKDNKPGARGEPSSRQERHFQNFIDCVRSRAKPNADILEGHLSSRLCHLGNIAMRVGRRLRFDAKTESFIGDEEANRLLGRDPRPGFELPKV